MKIDPRVVISLFEKVLNMTCLSGLLKYLTYASEWNLTKNKNIFFPLRDLPIPYLFASPLHFKCLIPTF